MSDCSGLLDVATSVHYCEETNLCMLGTIPFSNLVMGCEESVKFAKLNMGFLSWHRS